MSFASIVIGKGLNDPAIGNPPTSALPEHSLKLRSQTLQLSDLGMDYFQVSARDTVDFAAIALRLVREFQ